MMPAPSSPLPSKLGAAGTYTATIKGLTSGSSYTFRAVIAATPTLGLLGGTSATRRIGVR